MYGRGDGIRTHDLHVPNVALYQTEPHLDSYLILYIIARLQTQFSVTTWLTLAVPEMMLSFRPLRHFVFPSSATGGGKPQCYQTEPHLDIISHLKWEFNFNILHRKLHGIPS